MPDLIIAKKRYKSGDGSAVAVGYYRLGQSYPRSTYRETYPHKYRVLSAQEFVEPPAVVNITFLEDLTVYPEIDFCQEIFSVCDFDIGLNSNVIFSLSIDTQNNRSTRLI